MITDVNVDKLAELIKECDELREKLAEEKATVDRVWKALGISTYYESKPLAIDEHVTTLRENFVAALKAIDGQDEKLAANQAVTDAVLGWWEVGWPKPLDSFRKDVLPLIEKTRAMK